MFQPEEIEERKRAFAGALLVYPNVEDHGKAAAMVESRPHYAIHMATQWPTDPEVMAMVADLRTKGGIGAALPTKEAFSFAVWAAANDCAHKDTKLKYLELCAKIMGFIEKAPTNVINNNNAVDNRKVMLIPAPQSMDDWERQAIAQQAKLVNAAS